MSSLVADLRHALRLFSRSRAFAVTAVVVIAVGIATNVAVFSVADSLLFRPIGGPRAGEIVGLFARDARPGVGYRGLSGDEFRIVREATAPVARVFGQEMVTVGVAEGEATRRVFATVVTPDYFSALDATPVPGRGFTPDEGRAGCEPVVVVSHAYAARAGGKVIGQPITINGRRFTIVGVAPHWFAGTLAPFAPELWLPSGASPLLSPNAAPSRLSLVAVVHRGIPTAAVLARLPSIAAALRALDPVGSASLQVTAGSVSKLGGVGPDQDGETSMAAFFMMGMAAVVLLMACLNLANLLMARAGSRAREIAVRLAVGGTRRRILAQLLTESLLLSSIGAALGLCLGLAGTGLLTRSLTQIVPLSLTVGSVPDARSALLAVALAAASTVAFGFAPALRLSRTNLAVGLKDATGDLPGGRTRLRHGLVVLQLALSLVLLTAAGLFVAGALASFSAETGFALDRGIIASVDPSLGPRAESVPAAQLAKTADQLRSLPGVESVALATSAPYAVDSANVAARPAGSRDEREAAYPRMIGVTADYFRTIRLPLLRGRVFSAAEAAVPGDTGQSAVVDEALARELWPGQDPLGRRLEFEVEEGDQARWQTLEIVGVVGGVRDGSLEEKPGPHLYVPFPSAHRGASFVHARLASDSPQLEVSVKERTWQALRARAIPVLAVKTLREHRDGSLYQWMAGASAQIFAAFGVAALLLAVLGVYGVKSYLVACRRREIGIRVAVGATSLDILRLVLRDGAWLTAAGLLVGVGLSVGICRILGSWVQGIPGLNVYALLLAGAVLGTSALLAAYLPARRAAVAAARGVLGRE